MKAKVVMSEYRNEMCDHMVNLTMRCTGCEAEEYRLEIRSINVAFGMAVAGMGLAVTFCAWLAGAL